MSSDIIMTDLQRAENQTKLRIEMGGKEVKPIPKQYRKRAEELIHEIGQLGDKLWPFIAELGDNIKIECGDCIIKIIKRKI